MDNRIKQDVQGWWFWQPGWRLGNTHMDGSWIGPFDDRDDAEGAMNSSDSDDAQAEWEKSEESGS